MNDYVVFRMNDFLGNAGIVGLSKLLKTLDSEGEHYKINQDSIEVETKFLLETDLTQAYFDTLIEEYKEECPYNRILKRSKILIQEPNKEIKGFQKQIKSFKKDLESNRYKTGYESIQQKNDNSINLYEELKRLLTIKEPEKITECLINIDNLLNQDLIKETFFMKDIAYFIINRFWDSKSFLNRNNAKKSMKEVHKKEIEDILKQYLSQESKKGNVCVECGDEVSGTMSIPSSFVNDFSEDFSRKNSNYWNFKPNCYFCPKCLFLYTLIPLGFSKIENNFLFINANQSLKLLKKVNNQKTTNEKENNNNYFYVYNQVFQKLNKENLKQISNIQVITRQGIESKYRFDIINQHILNILSTCSKELEQLSNYGYIKDIEGYRNIYEEVLTHLLYNQELYQLLNELLRFNLNSGNEYVIYTCKLIYQIEERRKTMTKNKYYFASKAGNEYRKAMELKGKEDPTISISYKMLNSLKNQDCNQFIDIIARLSNALNRTVPKGLVDAINDIEEFKKFGYAFILGFRGGHYEKKEQNDMKDELKEGGEQ